MLVIKKAINWGLFLASEHYELVILVRNYNTIQ